MHNHEMDPLGGVGPRLQARHEELLHRATDQILASIPAYQRLVPTDDLLDSGRNLLAFVLGALTRGSEPGDTDTPCPDSANLATGRRRMRQGVALEDVLRAIRLDFTVLWDVLMEEADAESDTTETVSVGVLRIWRALDEAMIEITEGYRQEEAAQDRVRTQRRHRAMAELIDEHSPGPHTVSRIAEALEFDQASRFLVAVGRLTAEASYRLDTQWRSLGAPSYVDTHGQDVVAVTAWSGAARSVLTQTAHQHLFVVAPSAHTLRGVPTAVTLARAALHGTPIQQTGLHEARDLFIEALIAGSPDIAAILADQVLAPWDTVTTGERDKLLETLRAWADTDGTTGAVAQRVYRHRNTVTNHLRRIQELTGLSLTRPRDVATLVAALRSRTIDETETASAPVRLRPQASATSPIPCSDA